MPSRPGNSLKLFTIRIFLLLLGIIVALVPFEVYLQLTTVKAIIPSISQYDPDLGFRTKTGNIRARTDQYDVIYRINSKGFHDSEFETPSDKNDIIIALGDSNTFAGGATRSMVWPNRLESLLRDTHPQKNIRVHNFGVMAYSIGQEYFQLMRDGMKYNPRIVILLFTMANDVYDILPPGRGGFVFGPTAGRKYFDLNNDGELVVKTELVGKKLKKLSSDNFQSSLLQKFKNWAESELMLFKFLKRGPVGLYGASLIRYFWKKEAWPTAAYVLSKKLTGNQKFAWDLVEKVLAKFQDDLSKRGVKFITAFLPYYPQVHDNVFRQGFAFSNGFSQFAGNTRLKKICLKHGITCLDLTPAFREKFQKSGTDLFILNDGHINEFGHRVVAKEIMEFLKKEKLLQRE